MSYQINYSGFDGIFAVPNSLTDTYIKLCSHTALKIILLILRNPTLCGDIDFITATLGITTSDTVDGLNFWVKAGMLKVKEQSVELVPAVNEPISQAKPSDTQLKQKLITIAQKPKLTPREITEMADSDVNIKILLSEMQTIIGRTLSSMEQETLASLYSYARIPLDYILLAATYCVNQDKRNIRYIEKTILSWVDEGVDTYEKAEQYIQKLTKRGSNESLVRASIGIYDRQLTAQEKKYIQSWCDDMCFDAAMVKLAYEKTVDNIGKVSFPYTNTILTNWHSKGIKTPKQVMEEEHPTKSNYTNQQNSSHEIDELEHFIMYGNKKQ